MKKFFAIFLTLVLAMSVSVTAFAANGGFVSSPSSNAAPEVESFKASSEGCTAKIVVTSYAERDNLSDSLRQLIENAYNDIIAADDLTALCSDLADAAKDSNAKLAVSDLFDLHPSDCAAHDEHSGFEVVLKADSFKNFAGLLHMNAEGEWELIKDAKVINDGKQLSFTVDSFSPFAIVVDTNGGQTGDNGMIFVYAIIMGVSAVALAVILVRAKKQKNIA